MKRSKNLIRKLAGDAAFIAAITLLNRCIEKNETALVKRDGNEKRLNRQLSVVNIVYHAIGVLYNE